MDWRINFSFTSKDAAIAIAIVKSYHCTITVGYLPATVGIKNRI